MRNITILCLIVCFSIATSVSGEESKTPNNVDYVIRTPLPSLADEISSFQNPGVFVMATHFINEQTAHASHSNSKYFRQEFPPPQNPVAVLIVLGVAVGFLAFIYILFH